MFWCWSRGHESYAHEAASLLLDHHLGAACPDAGEDFGVVNEIFGDDGHGMIVEPFWLFF